MHASATTVPPAVVVAEGDICATPIGRISRALTLDAANQALREWLGRGLEAVLGLPLDAFDARPPSLVGAARRAFGDERRVWLRETRLRTALGDRLADLVFTPHGATLLLEVLPVAGEAAATTRWSETLRGFAHEVRGPLAGMRGAAQLLVRRLDGEEDRELAQLVIDEADRLATLAQRLLHSGAKPRLVPANVHEIVERIAALIATDDAGTPIRRDYDPSLPVARVDADRVQQALLNLARNALEAGARTLVLRTRIERNLRIDGRIARLALRVDVEDDGRGVPVELVQTLFEPLVSGRADGSGLGLAIAREIAREHGGDLVFASRPGATTFSLLLPAAE